jgi:hypothetical protein
MARSHNARGLGNRYRQIFHDDVRDSSLPYSFLEYAVQQSRHQERRVSGQVQQRPRKMAIQSRYRRIQIGKAQNDNVRVRCISASSSAILA